MVVAARAAAGEASRTTHPDSCKPLTRKIAQKAVPGVRAHPDAGSNWMSCQYSDARASSRSTPSFHFSIRPGTDDAFGIVNTLPDDTPPGEEAEIYWRKGRYEGRAVVRASLDSGDASIGPIVHLLKTIMKNWHAG